MQPRERNTSEALAPIVKWAGGKRQLIPSIRPLLPKKLASRTYCEPFMGGGALLWALHPKHAIANDLNGELMNMYTVVRDTPHVPRLNVLRVLSISTKPATTDFFVSTMQVSSIALTGTTSALT